MIPDEETYEVHDIASSTQIGTLDERFVVNFARPGEVFVQRGEMWRIAEIDDDEARVKVSPIEDPAGEVPSWIGQEIPVPAAVAGEVGEIRGVAATQLEAGADGAAVGRELAGRYPGDEYTLTEACGQLERQVDADAPMPTADRLVLERRGRTVVLNACFGHMANETLGRILSALLGQRAGSSVALETDPYRIELEVPSSIATSDVLEVLTETDPDHVEAIVELGLKRSDALAFRLAQVSGSSARSNAGRGRVVSRTNDCSRRSRTLRCTRRRSGRCSTRTWPSSERVRSSRRSSRVTSRSCATAGGRQSDRADDRRVRSCWPRERRRERHRDGPRADSERPDYSALYPLHGWKSRTKVKRVRDQPECPECGSTRIAALNPWADEVVDAVRAQKKDDEQERMTERAFRSASLVQSHGKRAVIAMAARGVGPHNAAQIINRHREDESEFYRDVLSKEREYARTQSFWD